MITKREMYAVYETDPEAYRMTYRNIKYIVTGDTDSIFCCFGNFKKTPSIENIQKMCLQVESFLNDNK
jgi:hypothetical protein